MSTQNLIIYKFTALYSILEELSLDLNFNLKFAESEISLYENLKNFNNYLIITNKKYPDISNQFVLENLPIKIFKLIEQINIELLKIQFNTQSQVKIKDYTIDLNSRKISVNKIMLKLTEKYNKLIKAGKKNQT